MNVADFIAKWRRAELTERSASQQHFLDLCDEAVFAAYGWPADLGDEAVLERLLALNLERAGALSPAEGTGAER